MTIEEKIVHDYSGYSFKELESLEIFDFWLLLRDASIFNRMQTKEGREDLDACWAAEQTEPDRASLRKLFGRG